MKSRSMSSCKPVSRWKKSSPWNRKNKAQLLPMSLLSPKLTLLLQMAHRWPLLYLANAAVFISLIRLPVSHGGYRTDGRYCGRNFTCGRLTNLNFPFWLDNATNSDADQFCKVPGFGLRRCNDSDLDPLIKLQGNWFRVLQVNQSDSGGSIRVAHQELWESFCPLNFWDEMNLDGSNLLSYSEKNRNLIIFHNCCRAAVDNFPPEHILTCGGEVALWVNNWVSERPDGCRWGVSLQVNGMAYDALLHRSISLLDALKGGFDLSFDSDDIFCYTCESDFAGKCERDSDSVQPPKCKPRGSQFSHLKRLGGAIIVVTLATSLTLLLVYCFLKKMMHNSYWEIEAFITRQATSTPKRFSFSEVKKITKSLNEKLGQGGYGAVYKGKLPDGRHVAVKILNVSKGNGQDFINEVASISRTSHINVVTLLGFCLEAKKRALIYEFMPNGSLDKFIYNGKKMTLEGNLILGWEILYRIAIGIAKGLEYLHNGCNTRIVHFDIKPHNILLDENLCPKISDFGLAKLCTRRESIVSLLDARGTMGYIAPEVFSRTFGNISHKSDVYSYGMMVLEMAGGRKNIDVGVSHTSEVYFPTWIYQQLELEGEFKLQGTITFEESKIARKMMIVGLWCIQTNPSDRPSMSKVIEMLEGSVDVLQIPPKPYLSSPQKAQPDCTFSSTS